LEHFLGGGFDLFAYSNPIVVLQAIGLLVFFANLKIKCNKVINWIASSSFAVYLLHCNPNILERIFKPLIIRYFNKSDGIQVLASIAAFIIIIYAISIVLDQLRKILWSLLEKKATKINR
jgi:peptidoglycan/LPS O-acetylase OafA/YrhL